jgi:hypothetical protein
MARPRSPSTAAPACARRAGAQPSPARKPRHPFCRQSREGVATVARRGRAGTRPRRDRARAVLAIDSFSPSQWPIDRGRERSADGARPPASGARRRLRRAIGARGRRPSRASGFERDAPALPHRPARRRAAGGREAGHEIGGAREAPQQRRAIRRARAVPPVAGERRGCARGAPAPTIGAAPSRVSQIAPIGESRGEIGRAVDEIDRQPDRRGRDEARAPKRSSARAQAKADGRRSPPRAHNADPPLSRRRPRGSSAGARPRRASRRRAGARRRPDASNSARPARPASSPCSRPASSDQRVRLSTRPAKTRRAGASRRPASAASRSPSNIGGGAAAVPLRAISSCGQPRQLAIGARAALFERAHAAAR